jgi:hypothetical protein
MEGRARIWGPHPPSHTPLYFNFCQPKYLREAL